MLKCTYDYAQTHSLEIVVLGNQKLLNIPKAGKDLPTFTNHLGKWENLFFASLTVKRNPAIVLGSHSKRKGVIIMNNRSSSERKPLIVLSNHSKGRLAWVYVFLACIFEIAAIWIGFGYKAFIGILIALVGVGIFVIGLSFYQSSKGKSSE